ncbi:MAG: hypothetical protein IJX77_04855 [Ruminococcus sp.]|nr:hypothetical protein [Ruminococcus sp.]
MNKRAAELREKLQKCSKSELIEVVMRAFELTYPTFSWLELVGKAKITVTDQKLEETKAEGERLRKQLNDLPESKRNLSNPQALEIYAAIRKCDAKYMKLLNQCIKLEKETYG